MTYKESRQRQDSTLEAKTGELLEPKLPPINLWAVVPADIFYARQEANRVDPRSTQL